VLIQIKDQKNSTNLNKIELETNSNNAEVGSMKNGDAFTPRAILKDESSPSTKFQSP